MSLDAERFSAAHAEPVFFEGERQAIALREAGEVVSMPGTAGQIFAGLHLNRDFAGNRGIVRLGGMFEDVASQDLRYIGYQLAAANPENPILMMNLPAHDGSDPLTTAQRKAIVRGGDLSPVAASQAVAARTRLEGTTGIIATGQSTGARLVPDFARMAGEAGLVPEALAGFSPVGLDRRPSFMTAINFFVDGYLAQGKYHEGSDNLRLDLGLERFRSDMSEAGFRDTHSAVGNAAGIFEQDPSYLGFLLADSPLSDDGGFEAIAWAMDVNPDMRAAFVSGGLDKVTRWRRIEPRVKGLVDAYEGRLTWDVWPQDGHSMGIGAQQPRFAAAIRSLVGSL